MLDELKSAARKVKGALLIGILASTVMAMIVNELNDGAVWANGIAQIPSKVVDTKQGEFLQLEIIQEGQQEVKTEADVASCACGSGIPIQTIIIADKEVTLVGLPIIFRQFFEAGKAPVEENINELMETIKIYNSIPFDEETTYRDEIQRNYRHYWFKEKDK